MDGGPGTSVDHTLAPLTYLARAPTVYGRVVESADRRTGCSLAIRSSLKWRRWNKSARAKVLPVQTRTPRVSADVTTSLGAIRPYRGTSSESRPKTVPHGRGAPLLHEPQDHWVADRQLCAGLPLVSAPSLALAASRTRMAIPGPSVKQ